MCAAKHCLPYIVNLGLPLGWICRTSSQRVHCVALLALEGLLAETPRVGGGSVQAHRSSHPLIALAI